MILAYLKNNQYILSALASILLAVPYSIVAYGITGAPIASLIFINVISFYLLLRNLSILKSPNIRIVYLAVNTLKLILLIFNSTTKSLFFSGVDWGSYDRMARTALEAGSGIAQIYSNSFDLFVFFVALIYNTFGVNINQIFFYIFPLSLVLFRYVYKAVFLVTKKSSYAERGAILSIAWPVNIVFSVSVLREMAIQLLALVSFYQFVRYIKLGKGLALSIVFSLAAALTHSGMLVLTIVYSYFALQGRKTPRYKIFHARALLIGMSILLLLIASPLWASVGKQFNGIKSPDDIVSIFTVKHDALADATTSYIGGAPESVTDLLISFPYRLIMFMLAPFPWQIKGIDTGIAFIIDGIPQLLLASALIMLFKKRKLLKNDDAKIVTTSVVSAIMIFSMYALGTNNYGTAMRHRAKAFPIAIVALSAYTTFGSTIIKVRESNVHKGSTIPEIGMVGK